MRVQIALGKNIKASGCTDAVDRLGDINAGQLVLNSINNYLDYYLSFDDGSDLTGSIFSENLASSAKFSARSARLSYLLGKATLLDGDDVKSIVRTQILEYGAVAEAILLDIVQSIGIHNIPAGVRPLKDAGSGSRQKTIDWADPGLFKHVGVRMHYHITFQWLIDEAKRMNVIDSTLNTKLHNLRKSRNLVHAVIPTADRYTNNLQSARNYKQTVIDLKDQCLNFKINNGLPLRY
ncbi:hypothetical protein ACSLNH_01890 [Comamonas kerstersii]|uniref:hypothetical protein n=1 Tax=Comamonas kerstersii TaxID=225992 RepID=UPI003EE230C4